MTIFKKVSVRERLPETYKYVPTIDNKGQIIIYRLTEYGWNMRDGSAINSPVNNNLEIIYWLEEIELPTDEEIEKWAFGKYHEMEQCRYFEPLQIGAKWIINLLK